MTLYSLAVGTIKPLLERAGIAIQRNRPVRDAIAHIAVKMDEFGITTLVDIGANTGQFAQAVRKAGYSGMIYSVEPLSQAHALCLEAARKYPRWHVLDRMALGASTGTAEINISKNLASSSLLEVEARSVAAAPESGFMGKETIDIRPLDDVVDPAWVRPIALKIDTQGFEREVLEGARQTLASVKLILVEMSLVPLYKGGAAFCDLYREIEEQGFRCIGLTQGFADHRQHELLQVDGLFVRD
jgi:FkbM family methyltransferase